MTSTHPNASQKRWRESVRELGSIISGGPAVIHHPVGRCGKHNKIDIGHWWVIPLTDEEHKALHNGETFFDRCVGLDLQWHTTDETSRKDRR